jgi:DNA-binding transcriptional regulator YiaG
LPGRKKNRDISAETIRAARKTAGLTQTQAGAIVHCALRTWQDWEYGRSKMHMAFFELFCLKTGQNLDDYVNGPPP